MTFFLALTWRLIVISLALFAGYVAASAIVLAGLHRLYDGVPGLTSTLFDIFLGAVLLAFVAMSDAGRLVLGLAALAILASELIRLRSWIMYAAVGALCGTLIAVAAEGAGDFARPPSSSANRDMFLFLAAGLGGGLVYWLIAGRQAGGLAERFGQAANPDMKAGGTGGPDLNSSRRRRRRAGGRDNTGWRRAR